MNEKPRVTQRAVFTGQQHQLVAELLHQYKLNKRIRRNRHFDDLVDMFIGAFALDNSRFMPRYFSAVVEFGPFKNDSRNSKPQNNLKVQENVPLVQRTKP